MELRKCGEHDLRLPALAIGCWSFGGGEYWGAQEQVDVDAVVCQAVENGCHFFDTAEAYNQGQSESSLGQALKGIDREKIFVATKISPSNVRAEKLMRHCEASLERLRLDFIDLYMVHWPITRHSIRHFTLENFEIPKVEVVFDALMRLQQSGKIRYIGVSNFGRDKLDEAVSTGAQIVVNELPYSLLTRAIEWEILPYCKSIGVGVLGYMPLMQGLLTDRFTNFDDVPIWRRRTRHFDSRRNHQCRHGTDGAEEETRAALDKIRTIANRYDYSMTQVALKWALAGDGITSVLCGSRNLAGLEENIKAANLPLKSEIVGELNAATEPLMKALGPSFDYYENAANDRTR